jgi:hypothetical protein
MKYLILYYTSWYCINLIYMLNMKVKFFVVFTIVIWLVRSDLYNRKQSFFYSQYTYIAGKYQIHLHLLWNRTKLYIFIYVYKYDCTIHIKVQNCVFYKFLHHYSMINDRLIIDVDPEKYRQILHFYFTKKSTWNIWYYIIHHDIV